MTELPQSQQDTDSGDIMLLGMRAFTLGSATAADLLEQKAQTEALENLLIETQEGHKQTALAIRENTETLNLTLGKQISVSKDQLTEQRQTNVILNQMSFILEDGFQNVTDAIDRGTREIKAELKEGFHLTVASISTLGNKLQETIIDSQKIDLLEAIQGACLGKFRNAASAQIATSFFNDAQLFSVFSLVQNTDPLILKTLCRLRGGIPGRDFKEESNKILKLQNLAFDILTNNFQKEDGTYPTDDKGKEWNFHHIASPEDLLELLLLYQKVPDKKEVIFKQLKFMADPKNNRLYKRKNQNKARVILGSRKQLEEKHFNVLKYQIKSGLESDILDSVPEQEAESFKKKFKIVFEEDDD